MTDELDKPVGTKEQARLSAGSVFVDGITIEPPKPGSKAKLVVFHCKHPDKEDLIKLSSIKVKKVQGNNEVIKREPLWYNTDDEGNLSKGSSVATVLNFYKKKTLRDFEHTAINTELDATTGFLVIKAY